MRPFVTTCVSLLIMAGVAVACGTSDEGNPAPEVISPGPFSQATATSLASDVEEFIQEWVNNLNAAQYQAMWDAYACHSRTFEIFRDIVGEIHSRMPPVEVSDIRDVAFSGDKATAVLSLQTANVDSHRSHVALQLTAAGIKMIGYGGLDAEPCDTILFPGSS